jgi:hypothetical protein
MTALHNMSEQQKLKMQRRGEHTITYVGKLDTIYKLGGARVLIPGNHGSVTSISAPPGSNLPWTDCSGGAFFVALAMGLPVHEIFGAGPIWTGTFADLLHHGYSDFLTFYLKESHLTEGHVIMRLRQRPKPWHRGIPRYRFAECGGSDNSQAGGGLHWLRTPGAGMGISIHERLGEFDEHRCIAGF